MPAPLIDRRRLQQTLSPTGGDLPDDGPTASVAAIFRPLASAITSTADVELLFIERATKDGDPWSGHMAFPGGRTEPRDADAMATAERETLEEIAVDLSGVDSLGQLTPVQGGPRTQRSLVVSAHAYWWDGERPTVEPNHEVADVVWASLESLLDPDRWIDYRHPRFPDQVYPGILLSDDRRVVWGLTLRFLIDLFERLEHPFIVAPPRLT